MRVYVEDTGDVSRMSKGRAACAPAFAFHLGMASARMSTAAPLHPVKSLVEGAVREVGRWFEMGVLVRLEVIAEFKRGYALAWWNRRRRFAGR